MAPDAVAFWETDEEEPKRYFNDGASYPAERVSARHNRGAINGTFGGSVSYIKFDEWYREVENPSRNRLWCYPAARMGGEPVAPGRPESSELFVMTLERAVELNRRKRRPSRPAGDR